MKISIIFLVVISAHLLIILACGTGTSSYNIAEMNNMFLKLEDAINNEDFEGWIDCYVDVANPTKARQEFEEFVERDIKYDIKKNADIDVNGSKASCKVTIETEIKTSGEKQTRTVPVNLQRTDDGWKIVYVGSDMI